MINIVIPMAGAGSRFSQAGYSKPKPFIDVAGKPMIVRVLENLAYPEARYILIARKEHMDAEPVLVKEIEQQYNAIFIPIDKLTEGTACTVLYARRYINNSTPLLIANSDQIVDIDIADFIDDCTRRQLDGSILTFVDAHRDPKWSFAKLDANQLVTLVQEKKAISEYATVGIYLYSHGSDFVDAAIDMFIERDRVNNEYYTCPTYNYAIGDGKRIGVYNIDVAQMHGIGTPEDLNAYLKLIAEKAMEGWSFCIVTAPGNDAVLARCIDSVLQEFQGRDDYEIIVVGNPDIADRFGTAPIRAIPFDEEVFSLSWRNLRIARKSRSWKRLFYRTGAISHKKNLAARKARYDKLCVMHDYVGLQPGWCAGFVAFGADWDVAMTVIHNADGSRHRDWMCWNHPLLASGPGHIEACLMPYDTYTKYMYISGTYFCVKRDFFLGNPLNEKLFWGEGEDVEWSLRVRELTRFRMNTHSTVRYLKLKNLSEAPYCQDWMSNEAKLASLIASERDF